MNAQRPSSHCGFALLAILALLGAGVHAVRAEPRSHAERPRIQQGDLRKGDLAPDFTLPLADGSRELTFSSLRGKPVVLVFGSCTCPPFVASVPGVERLYAEYRDRVHIYMIYIHEAHASDGWRPKRNSRFQVATPRTSEARHAIALDFAREMKLTLPVLVDGIDDAVEALYPSWPNRMWILDAKGVIVDPGNASPSGTRSSLRRAAATLDRLLAVAE